MKVQVIKYGKQDLLLIGRAAHKLNSSIALDWACRWFRDNHDKVKLVNGKPFLAHLVTISRAAADFYDRCDYRGKRECLAAIHDGKVYAEYGIVC